MEIRTSEQSNLMEGLGEIIYFQNGEKIPPGHSRCDLHVHSVFSIVKGLLRREAGLKGGSNGFNPVDCLMTPQAIVKVLRMRGVQVFALTDHDTTSGLREVEEVARAAGLVMIPGVEITVPIDFSWTGKGTCHLIVYGIYDVPQGDSLSEIIYEARAMGGYCVAAHPFDKRVPFPENFLSEVDGWEILNGGATGNFFDVERLARTLKFFGISQIPVLTAGSDGHDMFFTGDSKLAINVEFDPNQSWKYYLKAIMDANISRIVSYSSIPREMRKFLEIALVGVRQVRANGFMKSVGALFGYLGDLKEENKSFRDTTGLS